MEASKELKLIVESNRIPNALIFQGIYGSGKLRAAVEFTKEIFCKSEKIIFSLTTFLGQAFYLDPIFQSAIELH